FWVREHPLGATVSLPDPVEVGQSTPLQFSHYAAHRFLWGVYAGPDGQAAGEFLFGPADAAGDTAASLTLPDLGSGPYYIATPYDWGEASFGVIEPTATPTATATKSPLPTATKRPRPTATKRPRPTATPTKSPAKRAKCKNGKKRKNGKCKR